MSFASSLYVCFFMIVSLIQAALVVPRAASSSSCATTKTVTTVVTSTPLFTTTVEKIKTAKNAETYTDLYFTTVATAKTTPTVTLAQTTSCVPTGCDCTTSTNCYPGCEAPQKRDVNAAGATGCPTVTSTKVVTASTTSTVTTTTTFTYTPYTGVTAYSSVTATPTHTVSITSTAIGTGNIYEPPGYAAEYIENGQTFYQFSFAYFSDTLYVGSLLSCGCNDNINDGLPGDPCTYANVTYNCGSQFDCQGICAQINTAHGVRTCLGAVFGFHEYHACYLNSHYPVKYNGRCGLSGIDDNTYITGLLSGWESRS